MKEELLIFFIILLLGLIACSFLNVNFFEGMENNSSSQLFTGPNGSTGQVSTDANGQKTLAITQSDGTTTTFTGSSTNPNTLSSSNGGSAVITTNVDGSKTIVVTNNGISETYTTNANSNDNTNSNTNANSNANTNSNTNANSYDNYNHYDGTSTPTTFYGPNGGTAKIIKTQTDDTIVITNKNGSTNIYYIDQTNPSTKIYYGPNGGSAKIITDNNGNQAIEITMSNGSKIVYTGNNAYVYNSQDDSINQYSPDTITNGSDYNTVYNSYTGPNGGQATTVTGPNGNTYSTYDSSAYYNSLPQGIPRSQIPSGQEDLYILKSQVVPPVCPKCPDPIVRTESNSDGDVSKCPPCPACARCPEPAFDCKKVPNYKAFSTDYLPMPVLSDFSTFGM